MNEDKIFIKNKIKELFKQTIKSKIRYNGTVNEINHFNLTCHGAGNNSMFKLMGSDLFLFNTTYEGKKAVLFLFSIPLNSDSGTKHVSEKVMEIISTVEKCLITIDYSNSKEVRSDKFIYITLIKKYNDSFLRFLERELPKFKSKTKKKIRKKIVKGVTNNEESSTEESCQVSP